MPAMLPTVTGNWHASLGRHGDHLGVNEWHWGRCWSLVQLRRLLRSYEVGTSRRGCCTHLLYFYGRP
jgi:hypothetical protein